MRGKIAKIILAIVLIALAGLIAVSTYTNGDLKTTFSRADETTNWNKCNDDFSNVPCGICNVTNMTNGTAAFSCRLVCSGSGETCPGGAGTQRITGKWISCSQPGGESCDSSKTDFKQEGIVQNSPWTLNRGSNDDFTGTFPEIQCGRAAVEFLIDAPGVPVTDAVYDTQVSCTLPTSTPTGALSPSPSITSTPTVTTQPTVSITPSPTVTATPTLTPTPTFTLTPTPSRGVTQTPPPNLPQSGIPAPVLFIAIPMMLVLLGLAL